MRLPQIRPISFAPFKGEWKSYSFHSFRDDSLAALGVALMVIPQSIAYSLLAGLPPMAGLFSSIFGTIFAASFGSSRLLVAGGPTTGTAILLQTAVADVIANYFEATPPAALEALTLHILTQIVLLVGVIQIAAAFFNVNKVLQFVSRPVILGYFVGIMVAIFATQLFHFTGIVNDVGASPILIQAGTFLSKLLQVKWPALLVGAVSIVLIYALRRWMNRWPYALLMLILSSLLAEGLSHLWGGTFTVARLGNFPLPEFPTPVWGFPAIDLSLMNKVFPAALAISFLAILEVFSVVRNQAELQSSSNVNQDVFGLGIGNTVLSTIVGAMPGSGSITRTSLNARLHAKTRLAAILSGVFTALIVFFCWPLVKHIPLAALAALMLAIVPTFINWKEVKLCFLATREDAWVFLFTLFSCLIFSLDLAFFIGIIISIGSYLKKSSIPHLVEYAFNAKGRLMVVSPKEGMHRKIRIIGIAGELYFAAADLLQGVLMGIAEDESVQAIVLRLNNVHHMDASMCLAISKLYEVLHSTNRHLLISGLTEEVWQVFHRAGLVKQIGFDNLYFTDESNPQFSTWKACLHAQELIHAH